VHTQVNRALLTKAHGCALFGGPLFFDCLLSRLDNGLLDGRERPAAFWRALITDLELSPPQLAALRCAGAWWGARDAQKCAREVAAAARMVRAPRNAVAQSEAAEELQRLHAMYKLRLVALEVLLYTVVLNESQIAQLLVSAWPRCVVALVGLGWAELGCAGDD